MSARAVAICARHSPAAPRARRVRQMLRLYRRVGLAPWLLLLDAAGGDAGIIERELALADHRVALRRGGDVADHLAATERFFDGAGAAGAPVLAHLDGAKASRLSAGTAATVFRVLDLARAPLGRRETASDEALADLRDDDESRTYDVEIAAADLVLARNQADLTAFEWGGAEEAMRLPFRAAARRARRASFGRDGLIAVWVEGADARRATEDFLAALDAERWRGRLLLAGPNAEGIAAPRHLRGVHGAEKALSAETVFRGADLVIAPTTDAGGAADWAVEAVACGAPVIAAAPAVAGFRRHWRLPIFETVAEIAADLAARRAEIASGDWPRALAAAADESHAELDADAEAAESRFIARLRSALDEG